MTAVVKLATNGSSPGRRLHFHCPGCDEVHGVTIEAPNSWTWNGDLEYPTFLPSVLVTGVQWDSESPFYKPNHAVAPGDPIVCHSFVTVGKIQFLGDSTHSLADRTAYLPPWD